MGSDLQAASGNKARDQDDKGKIQPGGVVIGEGEEEKEHQGVAEGGGMDTDLEKDIAEKSGDQRQEGTRQKLDGYFGGVGQVLKRIPGPEIEDHGDDIGNDPFLLVAEKHGGKEQIQAPHQEYGEKGEKDVAGDDRNEAEYAGLVIELRKGHRMNEEEEGHHVAANKKGMEEVGEKIRCKPRCACHS